MRENLNGRQSVFPPALTHGMEIQWIYKFHCTDNGSCDRGRNFMLI